MPQQRLGSLSSSSLNGSYGDLPLSHGPSSNDNLFIPASSAPGTGSGINPLSSLSLGRPLQDSPDSSTSTLEPVDDSAFPNTVYSAKRNPSRTPSYSQHPPLNKLTVSLSKSAASSSHGAILHPNTGLPRHVSVVTSFFTNGKKGFSRLLREMDDYIFIMSADAKLVWVSHSMSLRLNYSDKLLKTQVSELVHQGDRMTFLRHVSACLSGEHTTYLRFKTFSSSSSSCLSASSSSSSSSLGGSRGGETSEDLYQLWELKSRRHIHSGASPLIVSSAREYVSKASLSLDDVLDLRLKNLVLQKRLADLRLTGGGGPMGDTRLESSGGSKNPSRKRSHQQALASSDGPASAFPTKPTKVSFSFFFSPFLPWDVPVGLFSFYILDRKKCPRKSLPRRKRPSFVNSVERMPLPNGGVVPTVQKRTSLFSYSFFLKKKMNSI